MNRRAAYTLLLCMGAYYAIHFMQYSNTGPQLIRHYAKDILFIPAVILSTIFAASFAGKAMIIKPEHVISAVVYTSVVFEWVLPALSEKYTRDWFDILAYAAGGLAIWLLRKPLRLGQ